MALSIATNSPSNQPLHYGSVLFLFVFTYVLYSFLMNNVQCNFDHVFLNSSATSCEHVDLVQAEDVTELITTSASSYTTLESGISGFFHAYDYNT